MKKWKSIVVIVLLVISILYGIFFTLATVVIRQSYFELRTEYDEITEKYEVFESQKIKTAPAFEAVGNQISDKAVTSVMGDVVVITLPYGIILDDIDSITTGGEILGLLLSTSEYKSCVLLFVDSDGICHAGMNLSPDNGVSYFEKQE